MKAINYKDELNSFLNGYNYLPILTEKLDLIKNMEFTQALVNEIILWKINRYVEIPLIIFSEINEIKKLKIGQHRNSKDLLTKLLKIKGIDLPVASTLFRFRNPEVFQIIDRHAYRAIFDEKYPLHSNSSIIKKINIYFEYIDKLIELCDLKQLKYKTIDRLLYVFDKEINGSLT